jgi:hypothetical protein
MKKHYKVVSKSLWSARAIRCAVKYKIGEWVDAPENTRLFVFDSLKEARKFYDCQFEDIYECEVKGGIKFLGCAWAGAISAFWERFNTKIKNKEKITREYMTKKVGLAETPAVLVKSVKLKKLASNK